MAKGYYGIVHDSDIMQPVKICGFTISLVTNQMLDFKSHDKLPLQEFPWQNSVEIAFSTCL